MHELTESPRARRGAALAVTALLVGAACIGTSALWVKVSEAGPVSTAFCRVFLPLPLLWVWALAERNRPPQAVLAADRRLMIWAGLFFAGFFNIVTGLTFEIPMAVQPMKAIATVAIGEGMNETQILVAGVATSITILVLALTGTVGYKPTAIRIPRDGVLPLSESLDSVGSIAPSVTCCAIIDAILAGDAPRPPEPFPLAGLRLAIPHALVLENMDAAVASAFAKAVSALSIAGARVRDIALAELLELPAINTMGGFPAAEAYAWHRRLLETRGDDYDPRVMVRIRKGALQSAADYIDLCAARVDFIRRVESICAPFDALILPTVPVVAPTISELADDQTYGRGNLLMLRNPAIVNFLDGCAMSVPCHAPGEAPVGLMIAGARGADRRLIAIARAIEELLWAARN